MDKRDEVTELVTIMEPVPNDVVHASFLEDGKRSINQLLFDYLPGNTTLDEVNQIACDIYAKIDAVWTRQGEVKIDEGKST